MPRITVEEFGQRLEDLRAQAEKREDSLLVGLVDLLADTFLEEVPAEPPAPKDRGSGR